jgi:hypothetical protein
LLVWSFAGQAQSSGSLAKKAMSLYKNKKYNEAGLLFDKAFKEKEGSSWQYCRAACAWALTGDKVKAMGYLKTAADKGWKNLDWMNRSKDLKGLRNEKEWKGVLAKVQANLDEYEKDFDKPLQKQLEAIYMRDQALRQIYREMDKKFGIGTPESKYFWNLMRQEDRKNEKEVEEIIKKRGWVGTSVVGGKANMALWLVIQHAPLKTQEKYLPMLRKSVKAGESSGRHLALLEDRILVRNGKPQIYGSQITTNSKGNNIFDPIKEPEYVNQRRRSIGLGPIEAYAKRYGIEWTIKQKNK